MPYPRRQRSSWTRIKSSKIICSLPLLRASARRCRDNSKKLFDATQGPGFVEVLNLLNLLIQLTKSFPSQPFSKTKSGRGFLIRNIFSKPLSSYVACLSTAGSFFPFFCHCFPPLLFTLHIIIFRNSCQESVLVHMI